MPSITRPPTPPSPAEPIDTTTLAVAFAALTLAVWTGIALVSIQAAIKIPQLHKVAPPHADDPPLPRLSIIVAAQNEERSVEGALRSLLALHYPDFEVIFVNDRSSDRTGEIADRLSAEDDRLTVLHVTELPPGWFGKCHAVQRGADAATGEVLLFTDGDVSFTPDAAAHGVRHLLRERLDHLSASPRLTVTGTMLQSCLITFKLFLGAKQRLWKVRDPGSKAHFGVGSCTFMRADSYRALGGHAGVALRPDEDLRLGQLVKMSGMRSAFLEGEEMIACPWYHSLRGLVRGVEKNLFAALDYSLLKMVSASAGLIWLTVAPIMLAPLLLATRELPAGILFAASPLVYWLVATAVTRDRSYPWWSALPLPLTGLLMAYMIWRSAILTMVRGVAWGGPPVRLAELKAAQVTAESPATPHKTPPRHPGES